MRVARRAAIVCAALLAMSASGGLATAGPPNLRLVPVAAGPATDLAALRGHRGAILLFWRADCAPCMLELRNLKSLEAAAGGTPLVLVGLQGRDALVKGLRRLGAAGPAWMSSEDPATVLVRFGGSPPQLPLAVAIRANGTICVARHGLIGSETVKHWRRECD